MGAGLILLEMPVEKLESGIFDLRKNFRRGTSETVIGSLDGHQRGVDTCGLQTIDQPDRLFMGDVTILCAMDT